MVRKGETLVNIRSGQEMTFLKTWVETNGTQLKIECRSPVTSQREKLHYHPYQENRFTLNQGQLLFTVDGKEILAKAGDTISIPKNVPHSFHNSGPIEAHYIQEFFPALKIDSLFESFFFLAQEGKLNKKGMPNLFRTALLLLHFENEIRPAGINWKILRLFFTLIAPISKLLNYKPYYEFLPSSARYRE